MEMVFFLFFVVFFLFSFKLLKSYFYLEFIEKNNGAIFCK